MSLLTVLFASTLAGILLWAGLEKILSVRSLAETLDVLGFGDGAQRLLAVGVPVAELITAAGLLLTPSSVWPRLGVAVLAAAFALAGWLALRTGQRVTCSCFGATGGGLLGWRQVLLLPVWLAAAGALHWLDPQWPAVVGLQYLAGVAVCCAAVRTAVLVRAWYASVGYRRAIEEAIYVRTPIMVTREEVDAS